MTIREGDIVHCPSISVPDTFLGTAIVRYIGPREHVSGDDDWLHVERGDRQAGGGAMYMGSMLWLIQKRYVVKVSPRSINDPPTRYGPYVPIPKELP